MPNQEEIHLQILKQLQHFVWHINSPAKKNVSDQVNLFKTIFKEVNPSLTPVIKNEEPFKSTDSWQE